MIFKNPRGEIRRGYFRWYFLNRTTAARHDATSSPCTLLGVVSEPSSELFGKANLCWQVPARGVAGCFCTKNTEAFGKNTEDMHEMSSRNDQDQAEQRHVSQRRLGAQTVCAPEAFVGVSLVALQRRGFQCARKGLI
jgi:hypothetical protein